MNALRSVAAFLAAAGALAAQPVVAPTPDRPSDLLTLDDFTVTNSFEVGYRFSSVGGNRDVYRSAVNYGNGIRLLEGELRMNSKDGRGAFFDELAWRTTGAGGDPYQASTLTVEKNRLWRYDMRLRIVNYFNRLPSLWNGEHGLDSERILQAHDLTLLPGRRVEVFLGYERNNRNGPGFSSEAAGDLPGLGRENFLRYETNLRQVNNRYRAGVNFSAGGMAFTFAQAFDNYKEDTEYRDASLGPGLTADAGLRDRVARAEPFHGNTPVTSIHARTENEGKVGFHGRWVYSSGNRNAILSRTLAAASALPATARQTFVLGGASRKQGTGDFTALWMPSPQLTVSNTTSIDNTRIHGGSSFLEVGLFTNELLTFEHLGIRRIANASEANYRLSRRIGFHGAYRLMKRRIRSERAFEFPGGSFGVPLQGQDNAIGSGAGGVRLMPVAGLRISFDAEVGRADRPLTPVSDRKFHNESARVQWRRKNLLLSGRFKSRVNANPASPIDYSSAGRSWGFSGSWSDAAARLTLDAGYIKIGLKTTAGIYNFFDLGRGAAPARALYASNLHTVNFGARIAAHERLTLYAGYALSKDTADGSAAASFPDRFTPAYPNFRFEHGKTSNFYNSFPLTYHAPQARVSLKVRGGLEWNAGWQYYGYGERFTALQGYRAHVGYTSLRLSFR